LQTFLAHDNLTWSHQTQSFTVHPTTNGTAVHARDTLCQNKPFMPIVAMLECISANGVKRVNGFLCPKRREETILGIQAVTMSVQTARPTSTVSQTSMIIWKRSISIVDAAKTMSKIVGVVRVRLCGALIKLRSTSCARGARRTVRIKTMLIKYELVMDVQLRSATDILPASASPSPTGQRVLWLLSEIFKTFRHADTP
jgi:hypothetical protein